MQIDTDILKEAVKAVGTNIDANYLDAISRDECICPLHDFFEKNEPEPLQKFGFFCAKSGFPYMELSFFLQDLCEYLKTDASLLLDSVAKGYLQYKLAHDKKEFAKELEKHFTTPIEHNRGIINAHLRWIVDFIEALIDDKELPEMNEKRCTVGRWLQDNAQTVDTHTLSLQHHNLHSLAKRALEMYKTEHFHRFLLFYIDVIYYSTLMREMILQTFTQEELISLSVDILTGLPNRFSLLYDVRSLDENTTLFLFNIKDFAKINLLFGQEAGDRVIKGIADVLRTVPEIKQAYRIYGDEFGVLLDTSEALESIEKIVTLLEQTPFPDDTKLVTVLIYGAYTKISHHFLEKAEFGIILGKKRSNKLTNAYEITQEMIRGYAKNLELSQCLQLAFADNRIYSYYQPIFNLSTGKIEKYEVLMRIEDMEGRILQPGSFLDVLKNMYIYPEVTKMMLLNAIETFKDTPYGFSINLSFRDIINKKTTKMIKGVLREQPEVAKKLTFELLEYEAILNFEEVTQFFKEVKELGVKIALDDFGSGYANFMELFRLDIDFIKIDGSIIQNVLDDKKSKLLIGSIAHIAKEIGAKTVAEFVSNEKIFEAVDMLGVDYAQGYYIGKAEKSI